MTDKVALRDRIIAKAMEFGADDAGVCLAGDLLQGPTHSKFPFPEGLEKQHSILVMGLSHPVNKPELDYYTRREGARFGNSRGNRELMNISDRVGNWLEHERIVSRDLHYYVERGGVFLKGAAVLAGLGTIGVNNLFIHPGYGPRIRFRAHLVEALLTPSDPIDFDPCKDCEKPCLQVCPVRALDKKGYHHNGCQEFMDREAADTPLLPVDGSEQMQREIRCCRICEIECTFTGALELPDC
jgi:epoxyqueuosine reductase